MVWRYYAECGYYASWLLDGITCKINFITEGPPHIYIVFSSHTWTFLLDWIGLDLLAGIVFPRLISFWSTLQKSWHTHPPRGGSKIPSRFIFETSIFCQQCRCWCGCFVNHIDPHDAIVVLFLFLLSDAELLMLMLNLLLMLIIIQGVFLMVRPKSARPWENSDT